MKRSRLRSAALLIAVLAGWMLVSGPSLMGDKKVEAHEDRKQAGRNEPSEDNDGHKKWRRKHGQKGKDGKIRPQAGNGCGTDFLIDAPWRIDTSSAYIPMVVEIKDEKYGCFGDGLDVAWNEPMYVEIRDFTGGPGIPETSRPWIAYGGPYNINNFEKVSDDTYFFHFNVPRPTFWTPGNTYFIQAKFRYEEEDIFFNDDASFTQVLRVYYSATKLPRFAAESTGKWLYGDLHWHGQWTDSEAESGGSYWFLARAANIMGIDWSVASEHASNSSQIGSSDPRDVGPTQWPSVLSGASLANTNGNFKLFAAEEIDVKQEVDAGQTFYYYGSGKRYPETGSLNVKNENGRYVLYDDGIVGDSPSRNHMIAVPTNGVYVDGKLDTYGGGTKYLDQTLSSLTGFVFVAHALSNSHNSVVGDIIPVTPRQMNTFFNSQKTLGTEAWNEDNMHTTNGGSNIVYTADNDNVIVVNPFKWNSTLRIWEWQNAVHAGRLERENEILAHWMDLLMKGLRQPVSWATASSDYYRKMFLAGGSDSHGDVNYKSYGTLYDALGSGVFGWNSIQDSGFAEPRNFVFAKSNSLTDVNTGLRKGRFAVTNGPIIDIGIDLNNDGILTEGTDYRMGDTALLSTLKTAGKAPLVNGLYEVKVLVRYNSTAEFGAASVSNVEIMGRDSDGTAVPGVLLSLKSTTDGFVATYKVLVRANTASYGGLRPGAFFFARIRTHIDGITDRYDREFDGTAITNPIWVKF